MKKQQQKYTDRLDRQTDRPIDLEWPRFLGEKIPGLLKDF